MSGLIADAKTLIDKARVETQVRLDIYLKTIVLVSGVSQKSLAWEDCYSKGAGVEWEACEERSFLPVLGFCRTNRWSLVCGFFPLWYCTFAGNLMAGSPVVSVLADAL